MVRIITDSAADFEPWELEQKQITCVPLTVIFGETEYQENVNLTKEEFYRLLEASDAPPKTAQASPETLGRILAEAKDAGDEAVYITLASVLSGTYQTACLVAAEVGGGHCFVVDSRNATGGQRMLVEYAVSLRDAGRSAGEIARLVEALRDRIVLYACIDTLKYLYQGGRISHTVYKIGTMAQVKPIIRVAEDGRIEVPAKAMGMRKGMDQLTARLTQQPRDENFPLYVMYTGNRDNARILAQRLEEAGYPVPRERLINVGAAIGSHIGANACGLDAGNVTNAVDMYLILRYLMGFDAFVEIAGAVNFQMPAKEKHAKPFILTNQNMALNQSSGGKFYRSAMKGGMCDVLAYKNDTGNQSYVSWASQDGETYIFCVMGVPDSADAYGYANRRPALYETTQLIDWVYSSFSVQAALDPDQALAEIPVKYSSETDTLLLYPDDQMMTILPSSSDNTVTQKFFHLPESAAAPVRQGDIVGTVEIRLAGETIGVVNLIAGQDVNRNPVLYGIAQFQAFLGSLYLKVVLALSAIALALYGVWWVQNAIREQRSWGSKHIKRH